MNKTTKSRTYKLAMVLVVLAIALGGCTIAYPKGKPMELQASAVDQARTPIYEHEGWTIARGSIHNHTIYSDGSYTPEDLLELARLEGVAILAYNDHREGKVCIGSGICIQAGGVEKYGYDEYYRRLSEVQEKARAQGMIATKGIEVSSPYFYNAGMPPNFVITGQFNHFTVYGIEDVEVFETMPDRDRLSLMPEPSPGATPYQAFVDHIHEHGGIVHSAHPESPQDDWLGYIHVVTNPPANNVHLKNLTGFSILPEGCHLRTGAPGGLWDTDLAEYLAGMRDRPVWASGDADFHGGSGSLASATTLFYMKEFTEEEVYRCMREGRMVALQGDAFQDTYVSEWWVSGTGAPSDPLMSGREVMLDSAPVVKFSLDHPITGSKVKLIRNGMVIAEEEGSEISFKDKEQGKKREPAYYRVEVIGPREPGKEYKPYEDPENLLYTNPIFVRFSPR